MKDYSYLTTELLRLSQMETVGPYVRARLLDAVRAIEGLQGQIENLNNLRAGDQHRLFHYEGAWQQIRIEMQSLKEEVARLNRGKVQDDNGFVARR